MNKTPDRNLIVALDIGTHKVVVLVGEINESGGLEIVGIGKAPSRGMKKGVVINIETTIQSIQQAINDAELMSGVSIESVYVGVAGSHIRSHNSNGIVAIKEKEVSQWDVDRVMDAARAVAIPADQRIIHVLPQQFVIDDQEGIREPVGMSGVRLEARVHLVTAAQSAIQNIVKCVQRVGLEVDGLILEQFASSYAVLEDDERELGVCLVDIGGGTSDIAVYLQGAIHHTAVLPVAGDQVTNDIAVAIRTPTLEAEAIKVQHGCALREMAGDAVVEVPSVGDREARNLARDTLTQVIEPRYEELFMMIKNELERSGFAERIGAGVVITGGSAKMEGVRELAEEIFHMPVRIGMPRNIGGLRGEAQDPIHSTGVGLLLYGIDQQQYGESSEYSGSRGGSGVLERVRDWFSGNF